MKRWRCIICGYIHDGDTPPPIVARCVAHPRPFSNSCLPQNPSNLLFVSLPGYPEVKSNAAALHQVRRDRIAFNDARVRFEGIRVPFPGHHGWKRIRRRRNGEWIAGHAARDQDNQKL